LVSELLPSELFSPSSPLQPAFSLLFLNGFYCAADFSLTTSGAAQPASHLQAVAGGVFPPQQQPPLTEHVYDSSSQVYVVPLHIMGTHTPSIVPLSNTHQVVSLKLTITNYLYWRMQMKPYLLGQGVFHFVNGSVSCPPSHVSDSSAGSSSTINPSFLCWKQQDQLILSALLSSLSVDVLHLVVDCSTSHCVWRTLEKALASPSNYRIMQLHGSFQDLRQEDSSVSIYMQQVKSLLNELVAAGRPMSLEDFNLYVFRGLRGEFKDLVTSLITKAEPLSYVDLHSHLLTHEFLNKNSFHSMDVTPSLLSSSLPQQPTLLPTLQTSTHLAMSHHSSNFSRNRGRSRGNWRPNSNRHTHQNRGQSATDWQPSNWQQTKRKSGVSQWSGQQHVRYQLCSNFGHTAPNCSQFRSSTHWPSAHHAVGNVSIVTWFPRHRCESTCHT
jgi:hypothetical protein